MVLLPCFSSVGQALAVGQTNGKIILFRLTPSGLEEQATIEVGDQWITSITYSPDGALLAFGDAQGFIRIWNLKTRQLQLELNTFTDPVTRIVFNPDGNLVASNLGGSTYFYALSPDKLINLVRSRIIRPMTPEECLTYLRLETCPPWP